MYRVDLSKKAKKDEVTARRAGYGAKFAEIMNTVKRNPFEPTPGHHFEKLVGNLKNSYSRCINHHNRFVYEVLPNTENARDDDGNLYDGIVRVHEAWGHKYTTTYLLL